MKKILLSTLFIVGASIAVSAQTNSNCHSDKNTKSCCKGSNTVTTNTNTPSSCCSHGGNTSTTTTNPNTNTNTTRNNSNTVYTDKNSNTTTISTDTPK